jgi:cytochrome c oxidase subunit 3
MVLPARHAVGQSQLAVRFVAAVMAVCLEAGVVGAVLFRFGRMVPSEEGLHFPAAFGLSTCLLLLGSVGLSCAVRNVRRERQVPFRRWLATAWVLGGLFLAFQSYGLWCLIPAERSAQLAQTGLTPFVMMLAGLHALHFVVAVLFLSFVLVRSLADRYDHEYYWGVTVCAWFWHLLGIAWMGILAIFTVAM